MNFWPIQLVLQSQACALSIKRRRMGAQSPPTIPSSPLKSRTAGFPRSGSKRHFPPSPSHSFWFATVLAHLRLDRTSPALSPAPDPSVDTTPRAPWLHCHYRSFLATTSPCANPNASLLLGFLRPWVESLPLLRSRRDLPSFVVSAFPKVLHPIRRAACGSNVHSYSPSIGLRSDARARLRSFNPGTRLSPG
jgi:hypothetical protein